MDRWLSLEVQLPSCFESILSVTVESAQGSQVYLEYIVIS